MLWVRVVIALLITVAAKDNGPIDYTNPYGY